MKIAVFLFVLSSLAWGQVQNCVSKTVNPKAKTASINYQVATVGDSVFVWSTSWSSGANVELPAFSEDLSPASTYGEGVAAWQADSESQMLTVTWATASKLPSVAITACEFYGFGTLADSVNSTLDSSGTIGTGGTFTITSGTLQVPAGTFLAIMCDEGGSTQMRKFEAADGFELLAGSSSQHGACAFKVIVGPITDFETSLTNKGVPLYASSWLGIFQGE
jgi:hypothetical protein